MIVVALDFETRSRVDLKKCGADVYASDPSTDILCCSFINKDNGQEWLWYPGEKIPRDLELALQLANEIEAHNARFDQLIYEYIAVNDYGFPKLQKSKWVCTAAQCRVNAMPSSLDGATRAANAKHKKDYSGNALIKKLSVPQKDGTFNDDPALLKQMGDYCMQDTRATVALTHQLRELTPTDKHDWLVNERINDRGVLIDVELATLAQKYAEDEKKELGRHLAVITNGNITKVTQTKRYLEVLKHELPPEQKKHIIKAQKDPHAPVKYTLDKSARGLLLNDPDLDEDYRAVIELLDQGGNTSVSKFSAMLDRADPDTGRVHGAFIFAGAGQTQRYSSKGLQLHNMRRDCYGAEETEKLKDMMRRGEHIPNVMDTLSKLLRPCLIPAPGHKFIVNDWSAIEGRCLPWLSKSRGGDAVLERYGYYDENPKEGDMYTETATSMNIDDRQIGKVANLSLGYGGAVGAFQSMAKNYGVDMPDSQVKMIVNRWRKANPWAVEFWRELEQAAVKALRAPKRMIPAGRVEYVYIPELLGGTLMCVLPNGSFIQYPYARLENGTVTAMKASVQPKADSEDEWPRMRLWGGFLAENITQAVAAALLKELLADMSDADFPIVGHVHDEVILEVADSEVEETLIECQDFMELTPQWAEGLPLKAKPDVFERYGK